MALAKWSVVWRRPSLYLVSLNSDCPNLLCCAASGKMPLSSSSLPPKIPKILLPYLSSPFDFWHFFNSIFAPFAIFGREFYLPKLFSRKVFKRLNFIHILASISICFLRILLQTLMFGGGNSRGVCRCVLNKPSFFACVFVGFEP